MVPNDTDATPPASGQSESKVEDLMAALEQSVLDARKITQMQHEIGSGGWLREHFPEKDWHQHRRTDGRTDWCDGTSSDCITKERIGFVGPREKFGSWYPFREYPSETGSMLGTATPTEDIGCCPITDLREGWSDNRYFHINRDLLRWLLRRQTILDEEMHG